jgi:hypothetical protein
MEREHIEQIAEEVNDAYSNDDLYNINSWGADLSFRELITMYDVDWNTNFKQRLNEHENSERVKDSIDSLNTARNSFAHGDSPSSSFENIRNYFNDCVEIINILDEVVTE